MRLEVIDLSILKTEPPSRHPRSINSLSGRRHAPNRVPHSPAVAGSFFGEVWRAADPLEFPVSVEERLRGGDRKIEMCLLVETLRVPEAEKIAAALASEFPSAEIGIYRLLCEITANGCA